MRCCDDCRLVAQLLYFVCDMLTTDVDWSHLERAPVAVIVITCIWPVLTLISLELIKKREIK